MTNLLERAISTDDADRAAKIIQDALGIESNEVANYCFPRTWPKDREQWARIIGGLAKGRSAVLGLKMANFTGLFEFVLALVAAGSLAIILGVLLGSFKRGT